jgi:hypothetical protein
MLQIMQKPDHWMYAGTALFFLGLSWRLMRWVWKTSKEIQDPSAAESAMADDMRRRAESHDTHDMDGA